MYLFLKRANRLVVLLAVLVAIAALVGVAGPRVASADGAAGEALLHKVYLGWIGGSIITPGPGEEAGGPLSFDDQNVAHLTVINEVKQTSVSATATQPGATIQVDRADEQPDRFREGYPLTVDFGLRVGRNTVTVTVTSADGGAETAYVINITRKQPNGRLGIDRHDSTRSFRIPTPGVSGPVTEYSNNQWLPVGLAGDPTNFDRFWVASRQGRPFTTARITVNAYSVSQASFEQDAGFELPFTAVTGGPIWSDGETMWVAGWWAGSYEPDGGSGSHRQVYAYQRSETGWARTSSEDVSASGVATSITGLSSDGETLWLTDWGQKLGGKVVAIDRQTKRLVDSLSLDKRTLLDAGITDPRGNWSDGETIWIAARDDLRLYAFDLRTKERISSLDIEVERIQYSRPTSIWSDGETMYVLQSGTRPSDWWVYAYDMHDAPVIETPPIVERPAGICGRTPQVRDAILAKIPWVSDCSRVTDADLTAVYGFMPLDYLGVTALKIGDFAGLTNLERLRLDNNALNALPEDVFDGLPNLTDLHLNNNELSTLPADIFDELPKLTGLWLHNNALNELPEDVFEGTSNLFRLNLENNELSELPEDVFDGLSNLQYLYLGSNELGELPEDVFDGLSKVKLLLLHNNELSALPEDVFDGLANLETLSLYSNELGELPEDVFDGLTEMKSLWLSSNLIGELPEDVFDGLTEMKSLWLSSNLIGELPEDVFDGLSKVKLLLLDNNELSALPEDVFDGMFNLRYLYLSNNELSELPEDVFDGLANLETLSLHNNELSELPDGVFDSLANLEGLGLSFNELSELPDGVFDGLANLHLLYLDENPGAPFTFTAELEQQGGDAFVVKVAEGAPFDMEVTLSAQGGTIAETVVTVDGGSVTSEPISVTPIGEGQTQVTINVEWAALQYYDESYHTTGVRTGLGEPLVLGGEEAVNTPATGAPTISGTAQVGHTLTASTSGIVDPDGLSRATFRYQWMSSGDTDIQGATGDTYTLVPADAGKTIKVRVSFTDDRGFDESLTSAPTEVVTARPTGICDRTQQVQDAIIAKLNEGLDTPEVTDCAEVTAEDLSGITGRMVLSIQEIPVLKSGDFEGLSNLDDLQLIDSGLETLPEDVFDGLTSLTHLFIIENDDLEELPEDIFDGLTRLRNLHVSGNEALGELPEDIFDALTSLAFLHLAENSLTELPEDIFDGLTSLQLLHLQNNQLTELPSGIFDGLGSLKYILLNGNSLRSLPADVFEGLSSLTQLPLEGNDLESLPDGLFEGLVSLEQVLLSSNPGAPFALTAELKQRGDGAFVVKVDEGSPFDLTVTLSAQGGTLSSTSVTVEGGSLASGPVSVEASGNGPGRVTVTVESATFPEDREYFGINTGLGQPLVLDVPGNPPAETVQVTAPASVPQNTEATVTMTFGGLEFDSDTSDTDYIFRADVKDAENGDADACEGGGMGKDRYMYKVDEDPEVRAATISAACPPGDYTIEVSISSPADVELASATADFTVAAPAQQQQAQEPPPSTDATLSGLTLSDVTLAFASATTRYTASVANDVTQTTVTPTLSEDEATYAIKLGGVTDADGVIPLAVGSNVITIEVTAEDGNTAKTYTVTVTRSAPTVSGPAVAIALSPSGPVEEGTEVTVTMSFGGLEQDSDRSDVDYIFRADVKNSANGNADRCEDQKGGYGLGVERYMKQVDEDPEVRTGSISTSCEPGDYTVEVSISSPGNDELASATADFTVSNPAQQQQPPEPPASTDATLSGLTLSEVTLAFASTTTDYTASVANDVTQTTVTPTTNDDGATHAIKLGGVADADGVIPLAVGSNVIATEVTAEDGITAKTYTVTVTRAAPPTLSGDATLRSLTLSDAAFAFASDTTSYDVNVANGVDETTVTATANDGGASYVVKLGDAVDGDGTVELSVGGNVIAVEVTAEDGKTTKTYTVTVTRADPPPPDPVEPEPESTGERGAWLEQNPENKPFVGEWQHFTLRGSGLDKVDLSVNVIGFGGAPSSTGAVGYATASPLPAAGEVCGSAYYSGYQMSVDRTFSLVGCREGTVIIELLDPGNGYALLKRYTVTVDAGP